MTAAAEFPQFGSSLFSGASEPYSGHVLKPSAQSAVLDALPAHLALLDASGRILAVNRAWSGFAQENAGDESRCGPGACYLEVCDRAARDGAEHAAAVAEGVRRVLAGELPVYTLEYPCDSPSESRWFQLKVTPLQDGSGGAVAMHLDITERRRAEEARRTSEEKYQQLWMNTPDAIVVIGTDGRIRYANPAVCRGLPAGRRRNWPAAR